jgi:hypothetical protein
MWVFILLLLIGFTIIGVRIFRNGATEESAGLAEDTAAISPTTPSPAVAVSATRRTATAESTSAQTEGEGTPVAPYPPPAVEHPGGPCPSCGFDTVPGAKFCGECGTRLIS